MSLEKIKKGECPSGHGPLILFKHPIAILYLLSEDLCSIGELEGTETPEDMFGYILGICQECGFIVTTSPNYEYDWDYSKWVRVSEVSET